MIPDSKEPGREVSSTSVMLYWLFFDTFHSHYRTVLDLATHAKKVNSSLEDQSLQYKLYKICQDQLGINSTSMKFKRALLLSLKPAQSF